MRIPTRRTVGLTATMLGIVSLGVGFAAGPAAAEHDPNAVHLKDVFQNTSQDDPGFSDTDCGGLDTDNGPVWHFIANNLAEDSVVVSMTADFGPTANNTTETVAYAVTSANQNGTTRHFYVQSTQPVLIDALATFDRAQPTGPGGAQMVLSHICPGEVTPPTTTTTTSTTVPETTTTVPETTTTVPETTTTTSTTTTSTTVPETTTTTAAPTTTTAAPTTTTAPAQVLGSTVTTAAPTEVLGVQQTRLPRTGANTSRTVSLSLGMILFGLGVVLLGQDRRAFAAGYRS